MRYRPNVASTDKGEAAPDPIDIHLEWSDLEALTFQMQTLSGSSADH
jgi:hypothetical protein